MYKNIQFKVGLFIILTLIAICAAVFYIAFKKDLFADMRLYTLSSASGEGLTEGMPVLFSGFQIGKVEKLELSEKGEVIISVKVPQKHVRWVRLDSVFTLEKPFIGSPRIVVKTENPQSGELPADKIVPMQTIDDINEVIKKAQPMVEKINVIATNIEKLTGPQSDLSLAISDVRKVTKTLSEKRSILEMATGDKKSAEALTKSLETIATIADSVETSVKRVDAMIVKTDDAVLGPGGSIATVNNVLKDIEGKFKRMDELLENVISMSSDLSGTTKDINLVRKEVDETISSLNKLIQDVRNSLPFDQKKEIKLP